VAHKKYFKRHETKSLPGETALPLLLSKLSMVCPAAETPFEVVEGLEPGLAAPFPVPTFERSASFDVVGEPNILRGSVHGGRHLRKTICFQLFLSASDEDDDKLFPKC
jgi:hypothetical protein